MHARDEDDGPVRIRTPVDASACPTVGANCRRLVTADAMGMAKERDMTEVVVDGPGNENGNNTVNTTMYPGSGLSVEITALVLQR